MYSLALQREFDARHFLVGGDWGPENELHSHHYRVELQLEGTALDEHDYLVDLVELEARLDSLVSYYADRTLNDLPQFAGRNPSIEWFARAMCEELSSQLAAGNLSGVTFKVWENEVAWAAYRKEIWSGRDRLTA
jgi:6-pyruvoyltetrahydropterin/6-carboxytetrahydropterin synthase